MAAPAPNDSSLWKWFFLIVILLAVGATASLWWFNLRIQLKPEEFDRQHETWLVKRPESYFFEYLRVEDDASTGKLYRVTVTGGKVTEAYEFDVQVRERRDMNPPGTGKLLSPGDATRHSMDALFDSAARILAEDAALERRVYVRATFHPENGAILDFVHRIMGTRQRLQLSVTKLRFGEDLND